MTKKQQAFLSLAACVALTQGLSQTAGAAEITVAMPQNPGIAAPAIRPPAEHPRLYLRATDLEALRKQELRAQGRENVEYQALNLAWQRLRTAGRYYLTTLPPQNQGESNGDYCERSAKIVHAKALFYLLDKDGESGQQAISLARAYLDSPVCQQQAATPRQMGNSLLLSALVYDWCYPLLKTDDKRHFIQRFVEQAARMEIGFPPLKQGSITGHGSEAQLMRDQLSAAIAFYDEAPEIYRMVAGRFFSAYIEPRNFMYSAGGHHQGDSYGPSRYIWDVFASWIFRRMGVRDVFAANQSSTPYQWLYMRRPDGQLMRDGDSYWAALSRFKSYWAEPLPFMLAASYYKDPYLKGEFLRQLPALRPTEDLWLVLLDDPSVPARSVRDLPLTWYAGAPLGMMIARTAWTEGNTADLQSPAVVAMMKAGGTRFGNHQHLDAGHFQLYYKGGLAIDSGIYQGANNVEYGSVHDMNYHKRTIAHNAMLVLDEAETIIPGKSNDGGQRFTTEFYAMQDLLDPAKGAQAGGALRSQVGPDRLAPEYSYLQGELSQAYSRKVSAYTRSFVFLNLKNAKNPAALIVFDRIQSSKLGFKKTWLLHSETEPSVVGDTVTITRTDRGYNGKLVNRTILPARPAIAKVGGPGREFSVYDSATRKYINYPITPMQSNNSEEAGAWRVEVSPSVAARSDTFLNAMQVLDATPDAQPLPVEPVLSELLAGVKIANRAVLFARETDELNSTARFTLPSQSGELRVLLAGLAPGGWVVSADDASYRFEAVVEAQAGTLYFTVKSGGKYTLQRAVVKK